MRDSTVSQIIEKTLEYGLQEAAHARAYKAAAKRHPTPGRALTMSGHYWARKWKEEAADTAWRCVAFAPLDAAGPEVLPESAP